MVSKSLNTTAAMIALTALLEANDFESTTGVG